MELISTKYSNIENSIKRMLSPLENNQDFIRYLLNLNDYPLDTEYYDSNDVTHPQNNFILPYDLVGTKNVLLTLFNPTIVTESKIYFFFSHINFRSHEKYSMMVNHNYVMDLVIPYNVIQIGDKLRNIRLGDIIMQCLDNQYISGIGKIVIEQGSDYVVNNIYQGFKFIITVVDERV